MPALAHYPKSSLGVSGWGGRGGLPSLLDFLPRRVQPPVYSQNLSYIPCGTVLVFDPPRSGLYRSYQPLLLCPKSLLRAGPPDREGGGGNPPFQPSLKPRATTPFLSPSSHLRRVLYAPPALLHPRPRTRGTGVRPPASGCHLFWCQLPCKLRRRRAYALRPLLLLLVLALELPPPLRIRS